MDLDAGTITVPVSKNGHRKVMIVSGEALDMLRARCEALEPHDLLFPGRLKTSPLDPKKSWPKLLKKAGLPADGAFHGLRKTTAMRLLRAGEARQREVVTQHVGLLLGLPAVSTPATVG